MRLPNPYRPEAQVVSQRLETLQSALDWAAAARVATPWVQAVCANPPPFWAMESLLKDYPIGSSEGLALMRLAEALLRVPDAETAIALTADQLGRADFDAAGDKVLARLSSSVIALSKHFLPATDPPEHATGASAPAAQAVPGQGLLARLGARAVVAATLRAMQLLGRQFVLGQTIDEGLKEAEGARKKHPGLRFSFDMLGEGARTEADALRYLASYTNAIESIAVGADKTRAVEQNDGISIKLSALHPRYEAAQARRVMAELVPRVWRLCELAARANLNLTIDAEEVDRLELSLDVFEALAVQVAQHAPQWRGLGLALQAYQTRALELIAHVTAIARRYGLRLMCRLVKGAYWDAEIKRAQELGLPHYPVFTHKHHTDVSYLACAKALLDAPDALYPQFATHNAATIAAILQLAAKSGAPFELQRLHGMGEGVYREVLKNPLIACRVYAPVGAHKDLLAYLVRRLLENGANSSFVHQLADASVGLDALPMSPLRLAPEPSLPLPGDLFGRHAGARRNSAGLDLTVPAMRAPLLAALVTTRVPVLPEFDVKNIAGLYESCARSYKKWSKTAVVERAALLRRAADNLQAQLPHFGALLVKESFKTWGDAVSEVREAVDFLRYYADEAERIMQPLALPVVPGAAPGQRWGLTGESNTLTLTARGVWVCISPWNFPLAIFMGQVAAALATGNTVMAKPAEQTPGVALEAVKLLHTAGVPSDALQLLHGPGDTVGAALVAQPGVAGVVFTGSTQVARHIHRALAEKDGPIQPLIAETGGINALLVDSSALPEQVCDAVMQSAFRSAGQRCSALRLLCVHEQIADGVIAMIGGAARELVTGDPSDLTTDVGPVIDAQAFEGIQQHLQRLNHEEKSIADPVSQAQAATHSIANSLAPQVFEVSQIDAVVGVQPFGGEGLSGTGPKAGGPHYLVRFCTEQTITVNTTAAGGNVALLA